MNFMRLAKNKRSFVLMTGSLVLAAALLLLLLNKEADAPAPGPAPTPVVTEEKPAPSPPSAKTDKFDKTAYSIDKPSSPWVVVNKKRPLPRDYAPSNLAAAGNTQVSVVISKNLESLLGEASKTGNPLRVISGYRSYNTQASVYNNYVRTNGRAEADTFSARPGHSEHQTGLAVDLGNGTCDLEICFGNTAAGKWLANNAYKYGFIIRYEKGKESITGYQYEPWHLRYVGTELAVEINKTKLTMEQFFGLPPAPSY